MAYFDHAYRKVLLATNGVSILTGVQLGTPTAPGATTTYQLAGGTITFINPETFTVGLAPSSCCDVIIAAGSIYPKDKIGPFHGGYQESNKTKTIKPQYVSKYWYVEANPPSNYIIHAGYTPWTSANPPSSSNPGENYEKHHLANIIEWWRKKAMNRFDTLNTEGRIRNEQEVWTSGKVLDIIR